MTSGRPHQLENLVVGDDARAWTDAGFAVTDGRLRLGNTTITLAGADGQRGLRSWSVAGVDELDGIDVVAVEGEAPAPSVHGNGVDGIDHVVVQTDDLDRTLPALAEAGLELRRTITYELDGRGRQQHFYWLGDVILELVGPTEPDPDGPGRSVLLGLALTSRDLDATAEVLGDRTSPPKPAVQPGRRISTLHTKAMGMSLPIAVMSPHVGAG